MIRVLQSGLLTAITSAVAALWPTWGLAQPQIQWTRPFGEGNDAFAFDVATDSVGRIFVVGQSRGKPYSTAFDAGGNTLWQGFSANPQTGTFNGVAVSSDGVVYMAGDTGGAINGEYGTWIQTVVAAHQPATGARGLTFGFGENGSDYAEAIAVDAAQNTYVVGFSQGTLAGQATRGDHDAHVVKHDAAGNVTWVRRIGTPLVDVARAVALGRSGDLFVAGEKDVDTGPFTPVSRDAFLARYSTSGDLLWERRVGGSDYDTVASLKSDSAGNAYAVVTTTARSLEDSYSHVVKYTPDGRLEWDRRFDAMPPLTWIADLAFDPGGNMYITGHSHGDFGGKNAGLGDGYVAAIGPAGEITWALSFGTPDNEIPMSLDADAFGNLYVAGYVNLWNSTGGTAGFVVKVPEPSAAALFVAALVVCHTRARRFGRGGPPTGR